MLTEKPTIAVAAGVILDAQQSHVLLSLRHKHLDQGGLWEYPGGKIDEGEE
ncbi:MAG: NUDIX domain-containing protein, partial [Granulosicoccaceae bacterium]